MALGVQHTDTVLPDSQPCTVAFRDGARMRPGDNAPNYLQRKPDRSMPLALSVAVELDYRLEAPAAILLAVEAQSDDEQTVEGELLTCNGVALKPAPVIGEGMARYRWIYAPAGDLSLRYTADVSVDRSAPALGKLPATPYALVPTEVAPLLLASRYCDPVRFARVLEDDVNLPRGLVADGSTITAIRDWIRGHLTYQLSSTTETSATDTYVERVGVCRDYAHLMIALSRAAGVPARFVSSYAWQLDPPDFHAVAEVWLDGAWHLIDATGLAPEQSLVRIVRSRDAVDASFMTVFGTAEMLAQSVIVTRR